MKGEEFSQSRISLITIETHGEDKAEWLWGQIMQEASWEKVNERQGRCFCLKPKKWICESETALSSCQE